MLQSRYLSLLAAGCFLCGCSDDSGADGSVNGPTGMGDTSSGTTTATTTGAAGTTTATTGGGSPAVTGTSSNGGTVTNGSGSGGASTGGTVDTANTSTGGSLAAGGTSSDGGTSTQSTTGQAGTGGTGNVTPRTECPAAPPATQKAPATDRSLAVSKEDYAAMLTQETPFEGTRGQLPWHSYTPAQAGENPDERFPLLVVLHGGYGREVTDGNILVDVAQYLLGSQNGLLTEANRSEFPTYIVFPHCRVEEGCAFGSNEWASAGGAHYQVGDQPSVAGGTALELVEHVIETRSVDPSRVYLTGNSMGGGGTWEFASRRPELFAAVLPVSGHPPALEFLTPIAQAKLPVWAFGGENDSTNPYADTVEAIDTIASADGCSWLTTYTATGHDDALWSSPYLEPELWSWLFAQSNSSAPR
ncbi:MAG TPA: dienelactone hydrolase family protein [Polyangiaceae bacterium]